MAKGILYVETRPAAPELEAEYHAWYETHLKEIVAVDGFVSARRFEPFEHEGPFVAIYEIDGPELTDARTNLQEALQAGRANSSPTVQTDPPPTVLYYSEIAAHPG